MCINELLFKKCIIIREHTKCDHCLKNVTFDFININLCLKTEDTVRDHTKFVYSLKQNLILILSETSLRY